MNFGGGWRIGYRFDCVGAFFWAVVMVEGSWTLCKEVAERWLLRLETMGLGWCLIRVDEGIVGYLMSRLDWRGCQRDQGVSSTLTLFPVSSKRGGG